MTRPIVSGIVAVFAVLIAGSQLPRAGAQTPPGGKALFEKRCAGCHALDRDKEGPRLGGVYGRDAGVVDSFRYSDALKKSGIKWTDETLDRWLVDPSKLVPDNDMQFSVEKPEERAAIIAYLKSSGK